MSDIPSFPYSLLWEERDLTSVANLTRKDGDEFFTVVAKAGIVTQTVPYPLSRANDALSDLRTGRLQGRRSSGAVKFDRKREPRSFRVNRESRAP